MSQFTNNILIIDDEQEVLSALKRLLKAGQYNVETTTSPNEALEKIKIKDYSLIISDYRMPGMNGIDLLEKMRDERPDTFRILLTGYADLEASLQAINKGGVYRFITKPWNEHDLMEAVQATLQHHLLIKENERLTDLTQKQNEELKTLNGDLEKKVKIRTQEISKLNLELQERFLSSISIMTNLLEGHNKLLGGHSRRVADYAVNIALMYQLSEKDTIDIEVAALLHDIGKFSLPEELIKKKKAELSSTEDILLKKHTELGDLLLKEASGFEKVATLIRHHHENFDGSGYPDHLQGDQIPLGSRIIALANAYDHILSNNGVLNKISVKDALLQLKISCPKKFDIAVLSHFVKSLQEK